MLDAWLIEKLRRREEQEQDDNRPVLQIELDVPRYEEPQAPAPDEERGVWVIDLL